ncbi:MAG: hypothetical protein ACKOUT_06585 [Novosphingobium sp.]
MATQSFALRHRWDSYFWLGFVTISWIIIATGFWIPIEHRFTGHADYAAPLVLVLHVWVYFGWMVLLTTQTVFAAAGRMDRHRKFGQAVFAYAPLVPIAGIAAEVYSQRFWAQTDAENVRFFIVPLFMAMGFAVFAYAAWRNRFDSAAHKRCIYLATAMIVTGAYARTFGRDIDAALGSGPLGIWAHWFTGQNFMLAATLAYDQATRGTVHRVNRIAVPVLIACQAGAMLVWYSDWWPVFVRGLLTIPTPP